MPAKSLYWRSMARLPAGHPSRLRAGAQVPQRCSGGTWVREVTPGLVALRCLNVLAIYCKAFKEGTGV